MTVTAFRVQNFMGFEDSGWVELRLITLLFGRNSSGKSALIRSLLLLRQSLDSSPDSGALLFVKMMATILAIIEKLCATMTLGKTFYVGSSCK